MPGDDQRRDMRRRDCRSFFTGGRKLPREPMAGGEMGQIAFSPIFNGGIAEELGSVCLKGGVGWGGMKGWERSGWAWEWKGGCGGGRRGRLGGGGGREWGEGWVGVGGGKCDKNWRGGWGGDGGVAGEWDGEMQGWVGLCSDG